MYLKNRRPIALVGMSNIGKSTLSKQLERTHRFRRVDCDEEIKQCIAPNAKGKATEVIANWMGMPFEERSPARQREYLQYEEALLRQALGMIQPLEPVVIDTTGSVIYLSDEALLQLRAQTIVVCLEATDAVKETLLQQFLETPKPVIWGNVFASQFGEKPMDAVKRCYPLLLNERAPRYAALAHIVIPYDVHRSPDFSTETMLSIVEMQTEPVKTYCAIYQKVQERFRATERLRAALLERLPKTIQGIAFGGRYVSWGLNPETGAIRLSWKSMNSASPEEIQMHLEPRSPEELSGTVTCIAPNTGSGEYTGPVGKRLFQAPSLPVRATTLNGEDGTSQIQEQFHIGHTQVLTIVDQLMDAFLDS